METSSPLTVGADERLICLFEKAGQLETVSHRRGLNSPKTSRILSRAFAGSFDSNCRGDDDRQFRFGVAADNSSSSASPVNAVAISSWRSRAMRARSAEARAAWRFQLRRLVATQREAGCPRIQHSRGETSKVFCLPKCGAMEKHKFGTVPASKHVVIASLT